MTYQSTITTDAPYVYWRLDESTGTTAANLGSLGGSGAIGASVQKGQTPAGTIDGNAMLFSGSATAAYAVTQTVSVGATWTVEFWVKNSSMISGTYNTLAYWDISNGSSYLNIAVLGDTGRLRFRDSGGLDNTTIVVPELVDGEWHHVAITRSGSTQTVYVDGASKGTFTGTIATRASATMWLGAGRFQSSAGAYMDEYAFYNTALTSTQVASHYTAGTVLPKMDINVAAPVMAISAAAPAPTQYVAINKTVAAPAMTLALTTPAASAVIPVEATADISGARSSSVDGLFFSPSYTQGYISWPNVVPAGMTAGQATVALTVLATARNAPISISVYRATGPWTESINPETENVPHTATPAATITLPATGTIAAGTVVTVDITSIVQDWAAGKPNYGIALVHSGADNTIRFASRENATYAGPMLTVSGITEIPPAPITLTVPAMTVNMTAPVPVVSAAKNTTNAAPVATLEMTAVDAGVATQVAAISTVPAITAGAEFVGGSGKNPDYSVSASAIIVGLTTPNAVQFIEYNSVSAVPAINAGSVEVEPVEINLTTGRRVVAPVMTMSLKWPGIYVESADRYQTLLKSTLTDNKSDSVWYKLGSETPGATRIADSAVGGVGNGAYNGYVFGTPDFNVPDGPHLRKAARFNGISDYFVSGPYSTSGRYDNSQNIIGFDHALTVEFSIRTTQLNGTVFNAMGGGNGALAAISSSYFPYPNIQRKLQLRDGYLVANTAGQSVKTRSGFIADGEWHHVVLSLPAPGSTNSGANSDGDLDNINPAYLMVDGNVVLARYGISGGEFWTPYAFMADADFQAGTTPVRGANVTDYLAGDLRDVVVRLQKYISQTDAQNIYYEWSDAVIAHPEPITVNLSVVAPAKAKGNVKRMLAIYGLAWGYQGGNDLRPLYSYQSQLSGLLIENVDWVEAAKGNLSYHENDPNGWDTYALGGYRWSTAVPFRVEDYMVYPAAIAGNHQDNVSGPTTVPGIISKDAETDESGNYVDYETGLPRFIDVMNDLAEPVTDWDAVTVSHYPWVRQSDGTTGYTGFTNPNLGSQMPRPGGLFHGNHQLSQAEWGKARDNLRDSLLQAAYAGTNIWIGEYHMAQHLGIIGAVDIHAAGYYSVGYSALKDGSAVENMAGQLLDAAHLTDTKNAKGEFQNLIKNGKGYYFAYPQANVFRRVVAEVEGLTDWPTVDVVAKVEGRLYQDFVPYTSWAAEDYRVRPNGLQVGDLTLMRTMGQSDSVNGYGPLIRNYIVSARPDGIVGRVISREMESYSGPGGRQIANPYKDNALTVAVERGSVLKGSPIRGRIYCEFSENGPYGDTIYKDADKRIWKGEYQETPASTWDWDSRRQKESILAVSSVAMTMNDKGLLELVTKNWQYGDVQQVSLSVKIGERVSWHGRGLRWMALAPDVNGDDYIAYAPAMTVTLTAPTPTAAFGKSPVSQVVGAMRLDLEVRQPFNFKDGTVVERALPMEIALEMRGIGKNVEVPPMTLAVSTADPVIEAETETITVYLDNSTTITLFLKEDN